MDVRFVYLEKPKGLRMVRSPFRGTYSKTLNDLDREMRLLGAREVVIQAGFSQVRLDGWPYSSARPDHPAVILQFRNRSGSALTFKATKYRTFEENLRAIALTLDALRRVDRYGIVQGEQYAGFKRLEAPVSVPDQSTREGKITHLRDNAMTEGERAAAQAALDRLKSA